VLYFEGEGMRRAPHPPRHQEQIGSVDDRRFQNDRGRFDRVENPSSFSSGIVSAIRRAAL
jgi:hypothetical protein